MLQDDHSVVQAKSPLEGGAVPHLRETDTAEDWLRVFNEYDVQFLVLDPCSDSDMVKLVRSQPGWRVDFEDGEAIIFARVFELCD